MAEEKMAVILPLDIILPLAFIQLPLQAGKPSFGRSSRMRQHSASPIDGPLSSGIEVQWPSPLSRHSQIKSVCVSVGDETTGLFSTAIVHRAQDMPSLPKRQLVDAALLRGVIVDQRIASFSCSDEERYSAVENFLAQHQPTALQRKKLTAAKTWKKNFKRWQRSC